MAKKELSSPERKKQTIKRKIEKSPYNTGQARTSPVKGATGGSLVPSRKGRKLEVPEKADSDTNSIGMV